MPAIDTPATGQAPCPRDYAVAAMLMLLATVPVMVSAYASMTTGDGQWFQRSGALMVLFSVAVEYHRNHLLRCRPTTGRPSNPREAAWARLITRFWRSVPYVCYLSIVMGTLIWSYGDLMFR